MRSTCGSLIFWSFWVLAILNRKENSSRIHDWWQFLSKSCYTEMCCEWTSAFWEGHGNQRYMEQTWCDARTRSQSLLLFLFCFILVWGWEGREGCGVVVVCFFYLLVGSCFIVVFLYTFWGIFFCVCFCVCVCLFKLQ